MLSPTKRPARPRTNQDKGPSTRGSAIDNFKAMTVGVSGAEWLRDRKRP